MVGQASAGHRQGSGRVQYRADIDGLRAIAVLSVVAYHAGIGAVGGGFVGVDIFFVISGYLITSIVLQEASEGRFSLIDFYERRVRRLLPALVAMLAATFSLASLLALPSELDQLGRTMLATLFFSSNVYFWEHSDYFDAPAENQLLLHTWSLAIEEQFYLVVPLVIAALARRSRSSLQVTFVGGTMLSLALCIWLTPLAPSASFYLLPTRAWELLLGALVAIGLFPKLTLPIVREAAATIGLLMIGAAVVLIDSDNFPGAKTLVPTVGTALIIGAGLSGPTLVSKLLSLRPLVFVGLISYSLYLWHWPVMVFQRTDAWLVADGTRAAAATITVSLLLAVLSWRFVEQPFRSRSRLPRPRLFRMAAIGGAGIACAAFAAVGTGGLPHRLSPQARSVAAVLAYDPAEQYRTGRCMISSGYSAADFEASCLRLSGTKPNYLLIGDSFAAHLWYGLDRVLSGANVMQATASGCRPFVHADAAAWSTCRKVMDRAFQNPNLLAGVDKLLIAARWHEADLPHLARTLDWARVRGIDVVLFGPMVEYERPVPRILAATGGRRLDLDAQRRVSLAKLDKRLASLAADNGAQYLSLWSTMCRQPGCMAYDEAGQPLQFDYGHLTADGSVKLVQLLVRQRPL